MHETGPQAVIEAYLQTFKAEDASRCIEFFTEDAVVEFASGTYLGKQAIEGWHKERFDAGLQLIGIESIQVEGDTVVIQVVATSLRLKRFRIDSLKGTGTFLVQEGKIREAKFAPRTGFADHMSWLFR
jgi:hypothetical protein